MHILLFAQSSTAACSVALPAGWKALVVEKVRPSNKYQIIYVSLNGVYNEF